jgi:putative toxin-antitoxin system antitoxin component (TIGR02293 family)
MEAQAPRPTRDLDASFPELAAEDPSEMVSTVREGLPTERFDVLRELLDVSSGTLTEVVGITQSTLSRRRKRGTFDKDESERILRVARLVARAMDVLDGLENARTWLTEPARGLGGERPLAFADTEPGAREVERLLIRLEHGVYG